MTREDLEAYIHNQFEDTTTNTPWTQFPHYKVFRGHICRLSYEQGQLANRFFRWLCAY